MIDFFSSWVKGLGLAIVVVSILEMLLPNNKIKKYIRVVMGVFILFNIISPFISNKELISSDFLNVSSVDVMVEVPTSETVNQTSMDRRIEKLYKEELEKDISKKIKEQGYEVSNCIVNVDFNGSGENSKITKIKMNVKKDEKKANEANDEIVEDLLVKEIQKIKKVDINTSKNEQEIENVSINRTDISNIKKFLIEEYEVSERCLEIN